MNFLRNLYDQRLWGFRLVEVVLALCALLSLSWVYISTVQENRYDKRMVELEKAITQEREALQVLRLKVAGLEKPSRIEALAVETLGMTPVDPKHEAGPEALQQLATGSTEETVVVTAAQTTTQVATTMPAPVTLPTGGRAQ